WLRIFCKSKPPRRKLFRNPCNSYPIIDIYNYPIRSLTRRVVATFLFLPTMNDTHCLEYRSTGYFSQLITDYLDQKSALQPYYNRFPTLENFKAQIEERSAFPAEARTVLSRSLQQQYQSLKD